MRCHNLVGATATFITNTWNSLTASQGCSPNGLFLTTSILLLLALNFSFYYRHIRRGPASPNSTKKPSIQFIPALDSLPYEPAIFLLWTSYSWLEHSGLSFITTFLSGEKRDKMWEGMDIVNVGILPWILYFVVVEWFDGVIVSRLILEKYYAEKRKAAVLPITEEKEDVLDLSDQKEVSIYEVIAERPTPTDSESRLVDAESNTTVTPRPSLWRRIKPYLCRRQQPEIMAEMILGSYYMMAFYKCNLILSFATRANKLACTLTPEQYFDFKVSHFSALVLSCALLTISSTRLLILGIRFAKNELKDKKAVVS